MAKAMNWEKAERERKERRERRKRAGAALPKLKAVAPAEEDGQCAVCKCAYLAGEDVATLIHDGVRHVSHAECVYKSVAKNCTAVIGCTKRVAKGQNFCDAHLTERHNAQRERRLAQGLAAPKLPEAPEPRLVVPDVPKALQKRITRQKIQCVVMVDGVRCPHFEFANFSFCNKHMKLRAEIKAAM